MKKNIEIEVHHFGRISQDDLICQLSALAAREMPYLTIKQKVDHVTQRMGELNFEVAADPTLCIVEDCDRKAHRLGLCHLHNPTKKIRRYKLKAK